MAILSSYAKKVKKLLNIWALTATQYAASHVNYGKSNSKFKTAIDDLKIDDLPDLLAPATFTTANVAQTTLDLNWAAVTNATSYTVQRATNSSFTTGLTTVYTGALLTTGVTGLTASTTYYFRVKATATNYEDSPYATVNATTTA